MEQIEEAQTLEEEQEEWIAYQDDEGREYYYNVQSGETQWEKPENFISSSSDQLPKTPEQDVSEVIEEKYNGTANTEEVGSGMEIEKGEEGEEIEEEWIAYQDDEGREYYYNTKTGETQWEKPDSMVTATSPAEQPQTPPPEEIGEKLDEEGDKEKLDEVDEDMLQETKTEIKIDPEEYLSSADAVLEPNCLQYVSELITNLGPQEGGPKVIELLSSSLHGHSAIAGQLALWLAKLSYTNNKASKSSAASQAAAIAEAANNSRKIAQTVIHKMAFERFTKQKCDNILNLSKTEAMFLEQMMEIPAWRTLLIDLSSKYPDSALLMYCLQSISKRGYHREINKRMSNQSSEYFVVFNALMASELVVLGKVAIGGDNSAVASDQEILELGQDLKRTCGNASYTFIYACELLDHLIYRANERSKDNSSNQKHQQKHRVIGLKRAIRKWERFQEDLIDYMLVGGTSYSSNSSATTSSVVKKRRVDVTLTYLDYYNKDQIKRQKAMQDTDDKTTQTDQIQKATKYNVPTLSFLKNYAYGKTFDAETVEQLLPSENHLDSDDKKIVGEVLLSNSSTITFLLGNLFKTATSRLRTLELRKKCSILIALAVVADKHMLLSASKNLDLEENDEEEIQRISKMLLRGCLITEKLENMVSFTVCDDDTEIIKNNNDNRDDVTILEESKASLGRQLTYLVKRNAVLAQGVLIWTIDLSKGYDFVSSAAYPTLAPSILSLLRVISIHHPFSRQTILHLALSFLHHSNKELSYKKTQAIKQQVLRVCLFLCVQGQALMVLRKIRNLINVSSTDIDSALLRYFIKGCLDVFQPPFSLPFIQSFGALLLTKLCKEALCSSYFEQMPGEEISKTSTQPNKGNRCKNAKEQLKKLIENFDKSVQEEKKSPTTSFASNDDTNLITTLRIVYCGKPAT